MRKLQQDTVNQGVAGSSPASGAMFYKGLRAFRASRLVQYLAVCPILLALSALFVCGCAAAAPTLRTNVGLDHVYVYGSPNRNYQCTVYLGYFNTEDGSLLYADQCEQTSTDANVWPYFAPQTIDLSLDFVNYKMGRVHQQCRFVAHAQNQDRTTSTVVDCRTTEAVPAAPRSSR